MAPKTRTCVEPHPQMLHWAQNSGLPKLSFFPVTHDSVMISDPVESRAIRRMFERLPALPALEGRQTPTQPSVTVSILRTHPEAWCSLKEKNIFGEHHHLVIGVCIDRFLS